MGTHRFGKPCSGVKVSAKGPEGPCGYTAYTLEPKSYVGSPLGPEYVRNTYMHLLGTSTKGHFQALSFYWMGIGLKRETVRLKPDKPQPHEGHVV